MSDDAASMERFLRERLAPRFGQIVSDAEARRQALQREVEDLRAARGSIEWTVIGVGTVYLNIVDGQMTVADEPIEDPFMGVALSAADWERFAAGGVSTGFFSGAGGRGLGRSRVDRLRAIRGAVRFVLSGFADGDWSVLTHFGSGRRPTEAEATVRLDADVAMKLQRGEVNPQMAFMQGQVRLEGNAGLAMQLGMALM